MLIIVDPRESHRESWGDAMAVLRELVGRGCIRWLHLGFAAEELGKGLSGWKKRRVDEGCRDLGRIIEVHRHRGVWTWAEGWGRCFEDQEGFNGIIGAASTKRVQVVANAWGGRDRARGRIPGNAPGI